MASRQSFFGGGDTEEDSMAREFNNLCKLTKKQRLQGFVGCFVLGFLISCLSTLFIWTGDYVSFGVTYTFGNMISIASSCFLMGPKRQCKRMAKKKRAWATAVYLLSMVLTLFCAFYLQIGILVLICVVIQFLALCWYCLSYIPYARSFVSSGLKSTLPV